MFTGRVKVNANFKNTSQAVFYGYRPVKSYKLIPCFWKAMLVASGKAAVFFGKKTAAESLPEIPIEHNGNQDNDSGMDDIPFVPASTGNRFLFVCRRTECQADDLFCRCRCCETANNHNHQHTEQ